MFLFSGLWFPVSWTLCIICIYSTCVHPAQRTIFSQPSSNHSSTHPSNAFSCSSFSSYPSSSSQTHTPSPSPSLSLSLLSYMLSLHLTVLAPLTASPPPPHLLISSLLFLAFLLLPSLFCADLFLGPQNSGWLMFKFAFYIICSDKSLESWDLGIYRCGSFCLIILRAV